MHDQSNSRGPHKAKFRRRESETLNEAERLTLHRMWVGAGMNQHETAQVGNEVTQGLS
jgi:hypothetical protein